MAVVVDTSAILASLDANDVGHRAVRTFIEGSRDRRIVPDLVLAEVDYLVLRELGDKAEEAFLADVVSGAWQREGLASGDIARALTIIRRYRDLDVGLVDATIVATAERLGIDRILTFDRRHFSALRLHGRRAFALLP